MKRAIITALAAPALVVAGLALSSCEKNASVLPEKDTAEPIVVPPEEPAILNVLISAPGAAPVKTETSDSEADEAKVDRIEVFVFNASGGIDAYKASDGTGLRVDGISSSAGPKTIVAVINAPESVVLNDVRDLDGLRARRSSFISDNATDHFVMYGEQQKTLSATVTNNVTVEVSRLSARIRLDKITRSFLPTMPGLVSLPAEGFEIRRLFLINVAADANYGTAVIPTACGSYITDERPLAAVEPVRVEMSKDELIYTAISEENHLAQGDAYEVSHRLYAYPNGSEDVATKLIMEIRIDGRDYIYPIEFPGLKPNYSYEIRNITVTRLGNPSNGDDFIDPDESTEPIVVSEFTAEIVVSPWTLVLMGKDGDGNIVI